MRRKILPTVLITFAFLAMMSVTALAGSQATVRIVPDPAGPVDGFVDVHVYVDVPAGSEGVSAIVVDLTYGADLQRQTGQRIFTAGTETRTLNITEGITPTNLFNASQPFDPAGDQTRQLPAPPDTGALRLYFEVLPTTGNLSVLTPGGRAATIRFRVVGEANGRVAPELVHAYRWTTGEPYYVALRSDDITMIPGDVWVGELVWGDANGDGVFNVGDVTLLRQFLADWDVNPDFRVSDVNRDGDFNVGDVTFMRQYLADWDIPWPTGPVPLS